MVSQSPHAQTDEERQAFESGQEPNRNAEVGKIIKKHPRCPEHRTTMFWNQLLGSFQCVDCDRFARTDAYVTSLETTVRDLTKENQLLRKQPKPVPLIQDGIDHFEFIQQGKASSVRDVKLVTKSGHVVDIGPHISSFNVTKEAPVNHHFDSNGNPTHISMPQMIRIEAEFVNVDVKFKKRP